jgi:ADP-dependent phosphofructokinase/glucokinase
MKSNLNDLINRFDILSKDILSRQSEFPKEVKSKAGELKKILAAMKDQFN